MELKLVVMGIHKDVEDDGCATYWNSAVLGSNLASLKNIKKSVLLYGMQFFQQIG